MHLPCLNIPDLMISLWRGTIDVDKKEDNKNSWYWAVLQGDVWKEHGKQVALCTPYIPGSFDRPPRNPAEKINSGYKAWEFLMNFFGLGPCLFYGVLPDNIWKHYCKLVRGFRLMMQESITVKEIEEASELFTSFSDEFEIIYVQRKKSRIHFVRPCIHGISHIPPETIRIGPFIIFSQWVIERTIGNLGEEIKNHCSLYANLEQRGIRRCQVNALKALFPDLNPPDNILPRGALDIGDGYLFLRARDRTARPLSAEVEHAAWRRYWISQGVPESELPDKHKVYRWAKLCLPNGQNARARWKEEAKGIEHVRMSRHVKEKHLAVISLFGEHNNELYEMSSKTYRTMQHFRDINVHVVEVKDILSVVIMAPDPRYKTKIQDGTENNRWFMVEKPGLTISALQGFNEAENDIQSNREGAPTTQSV
ncbi:hypothetical protein AAF712_016777 [Marasmius tenuissimus]|uniref:Uncharacterized protein n=1 Tax=Marasmius tenuissimus TaxID=585030 RepID=A0ABR2Z5V7_9AGAR